MAKQTKSSNSRGNDHSSVEETNRLPVEVEQPGRDPALIAQSVDFSNEEGAFLLAAIKVYWEQGVRHPLAAQWAMNAQMKLQNAGAIMPKAPE